VPDPNIVAIKAISPGDNEDSEEVNTHWGREIKALERMNTRNQDHIVRFLASFSRRRQDGKDYYLMFEWADGGSLRNLWETVQCPPLSASFVKAAIEQIHGLSKALAAAHDLDEKGTSYRHGDLKPANILRFDNGTVIGKLKIGDWGEAKEHNNSTEFRFSRTTARFATWRYGAPEAVVGVNPRWLGQSKKRRSRLYDVWAMGCIILEFLIWLLYGKMGLNRFNAEFPDQSPFYQLKEENGEKVAKVHDVVSRWMDHLAQEDVCQVDTALGRLLELVRTRLLAVKLPKRTGTNLRLSSRASSLPNTSSSATNSEGNAALSRSVQFNPRITDNNLTSSPERAPLEPTISLPDIPSLVLTPAESSETRRAETLAKDPTDSSIKQPLVPVEPKPEPPGPARILATEFESEMNDILTGDAEGGENYWFTDSSPSMPSHDSENQVLKNPDEEQFRYMSGPDHNAETSGTLGLMVPEPEKVRSISSLFMLSIKMKLILNLPFCSSTMLIQTYVLVPS